MGPICEIRVAIAEIRGTQKEALFWPDMLSIVVDTYNDSFDHSLNTFTENVHHGTRLTCCHNTLVLE